MNEDRVIVVPEYCGNCKHKLVGTEFMCPKCGNCVICGSPQESDHEHESSSDLDTGVVSEP